MCVCVCCNAVLEITWTQGDWRKKGSIQEWSADSCFILFPSPELVSETPAGVHRYMKHWRQKVWQILERLNMTVNQNTNTKRLAHEKANALLCSKIAPPTPPWCASKSLLSVYYTHFDSLCTRSGYSTVSYFVSFRTSVAPSLSGFKQIVSPTHVNTISVVQEIQDCQTVTFWTIIATLTLNMAFQSFHETT